MPREAEPVTDRPHRRGRPWQVVCLAAVGGALLCRAAGAAESADESAFAARLGRLAAAAATAGHAELAAVIRDWPVPAESDRQHAVAIPRRSPASPGPDTAAARAIWADFMAARRDRADRLVAAAEDLRREQPTRGGCAAAALLHRALRENPDHAAARAAVGWVRRGDGWEWPAAAARLDRGEAFDPAFGWLPAERVARYRAGERWHRGRWLTADEDAALTPAVTDARRFVTDHWEILSTAPLGAAVALARDLEETRLVFRQVLGPLAGLPAAAGEPAPMLAVLCADRRQYRAELEPLEPAIATTQGIYWSPTRTAWFIDAAAGLPLPTPTTVRHEAAHQLAAESRDTSPRAGERCGFWAIEAVGCHLESVQPTPWGWTVGGRDAGRVPAARRLLLEDQVHVPLADLVGVGRIAFQRHPRLADLYAELAGLADFFMNGEQGRHREAFAAYLVEVYADTADAETLARLCDTSYAALDAAYRRHLSR